MAYTRYVWEDNVSKVNAEHMNNQEDGIEYAVLTAEQALAESGPGPQGPQGPAGPQGPQGIQGPTGPAGAGLSIIGTVPTYADLPATGNSVSDAWQTADTGHVWTWDGSEWDDLGPLVGPPGPAGPQGPTGATGAPAYPTPVVNGQFVKGVSDAPSWAAIAEADVTNLVTDLAAKQATSQKAQANGYASLDADGKVPSAQLPATGGSAALGEFQFSTTISEPPASGRIRMNNADQTLATLLWISDTTSGAVAVGTLLGSVVVGEQIYIQDKNDAALYRLYDVTALPVAKAGYHEIAVTFNKGAGAAFANNETLFCTIQRLAGGGADLDYEGDYVAATEYQDGDVVVKDGIAYLCVGGPTTVAPDPAPWGAAALAKASYGTSLPASPVDGQEAILVDSLTNPSYQWRFRYNAGSTSPYKWEFVGGSPLSNVWSGNGTAYNTPNTIFHPIPAAGTKIVLPLPGEYVVNHGANGQDDGTANSTDIYAQVQNADGTALTHQYDAWARITVAYGKAHISSTHKIAVAVGATLNQRTIDVRGLQSAGPAGAFLWYYAAISALPVRVS